MKDSDIALRALRLAWRWLRRLPGRVLRRLGLPSRRARVRYQVEEVRHG